MWECLCRLQYVVKFFLAESTFQNYVRRKYFTSKCLTYIYRILFSYFLCMVLSKFITL
jgi:hypothetical protein